MAVALLIDSSDGVLARAARVKEVIPEYDGSRLDDIVDYLNYVMVPMFFAVMNGMFPATAALGVAALPLLASAYGFGQTAAKTPDHFFTGFPSYWNVVVFYLYVLGTPPGLNAAVVGVLAVLVFIPIRYVYPSRTPFLRPLTLALGVLWGVALLVALSQLPHPSPWLTRISLVFPVYYFALSAHLHYHRR